MARLFARRPLFEHAAKGDDADIATIELLIEAGTAVDSERNGYRDTPLFAAAKSGSVEVTNLLLRIGASVNARRLDIVMSLIEGGADVNARDDDGWTPLHFAADDGSNAPQMAAAVIDLLLKNGADASASTKRGESALHFVARNDNIDGCRILLRAGTPLDDSSQEERMDTAVMGALCSEQIETVRFLIKAGAKVDVRCGSGGDTLLHVVPKCTAADEFQSVAMMMLDAGARTDALNDEGRTPLSFCYKYNDTAKKNFVNRNLLLAKGTQLALQVMQL